MSSSNPGAAVTTASQPQASIGNIQKNAILSTPSITPTSVASATTAQQSFSGLGLGLQVGDQVTACAAPSFLAGVFIAQATVTAADTLQITFGNVTAGALTPPAGAYVIEVNRPQSLASVPSGYMNSF